MKQQELLTVINSKGEVRKLRRHFVESQYNNAWQIVDHPSGMKENKKASGQPRKNKSKNK